MGVIQTHGSDVDAFDKTSDPFFSQTRIWNLMGGLMQGGAGRGFVGVRKLVMDLVKFEPEFFGIIFQSFDHSDVLKSGCIETGSDFFGVGDV